MICVFVFFKRLQLRDDPVISKEKIRVGNGVNFSKNFSSESWDETLKEVSEFIPIHVMPRASNVGILP